MMKGTLEILFSMHTFRQPQKNTNLIKAGMIHSERPFTSKADILRDPPGNIINVEIQRSPKTLANDVKISARMTSLKNIACPEGGLRQRRIALDEIGAIRSRRAT